nr:MAG TPA: hypothetical protein [Caudoviricetes sp.]
MENIERVLLSLISTSVKAFAFVSFNFIIIFFI